MSYVIRKAILDDADDLAFVLTESWKSSYEDIIPLEELKVHTNLYDASERFKKRLKNPNGEFYIAFDNGKPCGHIMFCRSRDSDVPSYAEIVAVYTLEEYWNKGLGGELMNRALNDITDAGYKNIILWVFKDNNRARRFYEKMGFIVDGKEKISKFSNNAVEVRYIKDF